MSALNGKWKMVSSENTAPVFKSMGLTEDALKMTAAHDDLSNDIVDIVTVSDDKVLIVVTMKGEEKHRMNYELNKQMEKTTQAGRKYTVFHTLKDNVLKTVQKGQDYTAEFTTTPSGDDLTVVLKITDKGITGTRKYKKTV